MNVEIYPFCNSVDVNKFLTLSIVRQALKEGYVLLDIPANLNMNLRSYYNYLKMEEEDEQICKNYN